jgi:NitT/TauT family transport system substrate-binding protein
MRLEPRTSWLGALLGALLALSSAACERSAPPQPVPADPTPAAPPRPRVERAPLRIGYSDWPGWVAWQIAIEKGFFTTLGVDVSFAWLEYVPSIEAFSEGKVDAVCMTNGDALVAGSSGAPSVGVVINDYSNGNDMVVARAGITSVAQLRGQRIGVEIGFVAHLLLMEALGSASLTESDVHIVNAKTHETPELLASGGVDAIAAWQPHSGRALDEATGSRAVFTSANAPGLIYDMLFVSRASLELRRADWLAVVKAWFMVVDFISDPSHREEAMAIMARRVGVPLQRYAKLMSGTRLLGREENEHRYRPLPGVDSVIGSSETVDHFNVRNHVYKDPVAVAPYFDGSLVADVLPPGADRPR